MIAFATVEYVRPALLANNSTSLYSGIWICIDQTLAKEIGQIQSNVKKLCA